MVSMRLKRLGSKERPYYRIVVMDSRLSRSSRTIDELGQYRPVEKDNQLALDKEKIEEWLKKGAQPSPTVKKLLNKSGINVVRK